MKLAAQEQGGIVLEAALILPIFLTFIVALVTFVHISITEMALQSAVSESTKLIAVHLYPVELLYSEAKDQYDQSKLASGINSVLERVKTVREKAIGAEDFVDQYANLIPEPVIQLLQWEKAKREQGEALAEGEVERVTKEMIQPMINKAFTSLVNVYADPHLLAHENLHVTSVILPSFEDKEKAYLGIEAQYEFKLSLPFFHRVLILKKIAYERAWLGA